MKKIAVIILILLAMRGTAFAAEQINVWAIGDCHKIDPVTGKDFNPFVPKDIAKKNYLWDSRTNTVTLFGARNEYVSFQIVIEAKDEDLKDVNVNFSDLTGSGVIKSENIKLFKEHYTHVWRKSNWPLPSTGLGEYPDALIPFDAPKLGAPFSIAKGRNQAVWVDLYIPKETNAGEYIGSFDVLVGGIVAKNVKVVLNIWDFDLPDENHLIFWSNYGYEMIMRDYGVQAADEKYIAVEESIWKISHEHRLNALLRHAQIRPPVDYNQYGQPMIGYQDYDYRLGKYLSGKIFANKLPPDIFLLPLSGGTEYRWPRAGSSTDPDGAFIFACKDFAAYFREMRWGPMLPKSYIYLSDETDAAGLDKIVYDAKLIHDADKQLKTMVALFTIFNADTVRKLAGSVDMWLVDASYYKHNLLNSRKALGEKIGFYQQGEPWCGNENLDSDGLSFVTWPWIAWKYGADCVYMYHMNYWSGLENGHTVWDFARTQDWSNSQGVLIYAGSYIGQTDVVGSLRLKQIRRGMQDYEYMYLAKQKGANPDGVVNSIVVRALDEARRPGGSYGEWSHDPADWFMARKNLADLILGKEFTPIKSKIPNGEARIEGKGIKATIKERLKSILKAIPKKLKHPNLLFLGKPNYVSNFSVGNNDGWEGGQVIDKDGRLALQAVSGSGDFLFLELWKKLPVRADTVLTLSYFYQGDDPLIIQFWSETHKKNFSHQINSLVKGRWANVRYILKDISPELADTEIDSIHIATLNKPSTVLMIEKAELK